MNKIHENNNKFLLALKNKQYDFANDLILDGIPNLIFNDLNTYDKKYQSFLLNELKFNLRFLFEDNQFNLAKKIINKFNIKRSNIQGDNILTIDDITSIGEYLISKNSDSIHFFWSYFLNDEKTDIKILNRLCLKAVEFKNTNFLSSYPIIKNIFNNNTLLKIAINNSFSKTTSEEFFKNIKQFYAVFNPNFSFKLNYLKILKHQCLIRNIEDLQSNEFLNLKKITSYYYPENFEFKLLYCIYKSLNKKPENTVTFSEYGDHILKTYSIYDIEIHAKFLLKINPELKNKFNLLKKLDKNLDSNIILQKINKI